jgi:hypothetical protein
LSSSLHKRPDIDIDVPSDFDPLEVFPGVVRASRVLNEDLAPHPCGYYFQNIPVDPETELSAIPFKEAEKVGFTKIDFLHLHVYDDFQNQNEIRALLKIEPNWSELLARKEIVETLFQLSKHWKTVDLIKPDSLPVVADIMALIRPGKKHLIRGYARGEVSPDDIYSPDAKGYVFKKSHAYGYAHVVKLQLNLISL